MSLGIVDVKEVLLEMLIGGLWPITSLMKLVLFMKLKARMKANLVMLKLSVEIALQAKDAGLEKMLKSMGYLDMLKFKVKNQ